VIVNAVVVLVGYPRVVDTRLSRVAASGWRFCGDTMWWGMLVVLFLSLEFSGNFAFPFCMWFFALLVLVRLCSLVSLSLLLDLSTCGESNMDKNNYPCYSPHR